MSQSTVLETAVPIVVARGDGIGPEIMDATLAMLDAAGARLGVAEVEIGEAVYRRGASAGIEDDAWRTLRERKVMLKAPIMTPQGGGFKSLNVTLRKTLGLYANVRPCVSYRPALGYGPERMDVIIVRENEEDTYAGIEHRQSDEVVQCLKLISRPGCERIARYAFELARAHGRRKVTCMTKDNIMKLTDGLFHSVFKAVAQEYPEIENEHLIIDIGTARMATRPERFDVVLAPNLYGDILSDVAAEVAGSIGLAGSANIGVNEAMFEAVHGSAPDIAGQGVANPSGLLQAAVMMLVHVGQNAVAERLQNAFLRTLEDGIHTADMRGPLTRRQVGTRDFTAAVVERLGQEPRTLPKASFNVGRSVSAAKSSAPLLPRSKAKMQRVGIDIFVNWDDADRNAEVLARGLKSAVDGGLELTMITNRGVKVWPNGLPETVCVDHWRCRFHAGGRAVDVPELMALINRIHAAGLNVVKTEHLFEFDGKPGYSLGQGQ